MCSDDLAVLVTVLLALEGAKYPMVPFSITLA
jgi:hypothetical protein